MLITGEVDGLGWYEVPRETFPVWEIQGFSGDQDSRVVTVLCPLDAMPDEWTTATLMEKPGHLAFRHQRDVGIRLIEADRLPGRLIAYDRTAFQAFDFRAWLSERIEIPDSIEFRLDVAVNHGKATAVARTMRKGHVTDVARKMNRSGLLTEEIQPILRYFVKNCPRVEEGSKPWATCGKHVAALLQHVDPAGRELVDAWMRNGRSGRLSVPGALLPGTGVDVLKMWESSKSDATLTEIWVQGHHLADDDTGTTVMLDARLPESVITGLKGADMTRVVDAPWMGGLTIRSASSTDTGRVRIRTQADGVEMSLPTPRPETIEDTRTRIKSLHGIRKGQHEAWMQIDATVAAALSTLKPEDAATIISLMAVCEEPLRLDPYGLPGWILKRNASRIYVDHCPTIKLFEYAETLLTDEGAGR